jgi:hypothetical protein
VAVCQPVSVAGCAAVGSIDQARHLKHLPGQGEVVTLAWVLIGGCGWCGWWWSAALHQGTRQQQQKAADWRGRHKMHRKT